MHSDALGIEEEEQDEELMDEDTEDTEPRLIYISSVIAARGITLEDIRCVFIHPYCRKTLLHQSGCDVLGDEVVGAELLANMVGRAGRTSPGLVFYLFELDDFLEAVRTLKLTRASLRRREQEATGRGAQLSPNIAGSAHACRDEDGQCQVSLRGEAHPQDV